MSNLPNHYQILSIHTLESGKSGLKSGFVCIFVEQLQKHGVYNFYGQAGDAILLNSNCLHGLTLRKTKIERRILQIYYSHPSSPEVGDNTIIPPRLWRDNPDPRIRRFFSKHNSYSKLVNQAMGLELNNY